MMHSSQLRPRTDERALYGRDIICFSNDWDGDPLSKTHLMRLLANDNRILWVNSLGNRAPRASVYDTRRIIKKLSAVFAGLKEVEPSIHVLAPFAWPFFGSNWARSFNRLVLKWQIRRAMNRLDFRRPIIWSFLPAAEWVAAELKSELLIYHCVDEFSAFSDAPSQQIANTEARLVKAADLVITSAARLHQNKLALNPRTVLVRHGVDHAHFAQALDAHTTIPAEINYLPRPRYGFFGLIADWVDLELLEKLALANSRASVVLIGKTRVDVSRLQSRPNVHFLGSKPYDQLPAYAKAFDVALMPFRINELTLNSNPLKVREYLAAGLPVVSTAIPEVEQLGECLIGRDHDDFIAKVHKALESPGPRRERSNSVLKESWAARVEEIRGHVAALTRHQLLNHQ